MSDIDDELLALAGGDVSEGEDAGEAMDISRDNSSPRHRDDAASDKDDDDDKDAPRRGTSARRAKRRSEDDEEEEEGEASPPGSPGSQMSAPMDESDSDSDTPQARTRAAAADDDNPYPVEGLFKSLEEKARIMSMREIEREQILAERREENERIRQNRMLRQLKVNQEKEKEKEKEKDMSKKRKAVDLDDDDDLHTGRRTDLRKSSRARTRADQSSDKMDSLRRAREERTSRKEARERENDRRRRDRDRDRSESSYGRSRSRSRDRYNRRPSSRDSDDYRRSKSRNRSRSPEPRESPPADMRDIERVRVGRSRFADYCFHPLFEQAMIGCFVRINIGPDPATRQEVYRMAVIKGFSKGRPYAIPDHSGHPMVVDTYVKAAHGKAQRDWPFISCSNNKFTEAEFNRYKQVCLAEGVPFPTKDELISKIDDINRMVNYVWTDEELNEKLRRVREMHAKYGPFQREAVQKQLELARARGDEEAVARLQERLDSLEVPRLAFRTGSLFPQMKTSTTATTTTTTTTTTSSSSSSSHGGNGENGNGVGLSQQERLARKNLENRKYNSEMVRKAQLAERAKAREIELRTLRGEPVEDGDLSRRVRTRVKFHYDPSQDSLVTPKKVVQSNGTSGTNTPANGENKEEVLPVIAKLKEQQWEQAKKQGGMPSIHRPLMDDDIIGAIDLELDVDIN